jgi:hypothetical protein
MTWILQWPSRWFTVRENKKHKMLNEIDSALLIPQAVREDAQAGDISFLKSVESVLSDVISHKDVCYQSFLDACKPDSYS